MEQQLWVSKLLGYDYEIIYRKGAENSAADALSRRIENFALHVSSPIFSKLDDIVQEYSSDAEISLLSDRLKSSQFVPNYSYDGVVLRYKNRIVVPCSSPWCHKILYEYHSSPSSGHSRFLRTYK